MDSNYANAGGGGGGGGGGGHAAGVAIGLGTGVSARYSASYYKEPAASCQRSMSCNAYEPYGGSGTGVRPSSAYPYDADAEFKERTGMGKSKSSHLTMSSLSAGKMQQHSYNVNNCYGTLGQNVNAMAAESTNYYAYAYNQHPPYPQQQQQQPYHHQSQLEQQYKYNMTAKSGEHQQQQQQQQTHRHQQQQHQQQHQQQSAVNAMKMSTPEYGYAPYRLQHPYYHPHYHHALSQKGGVGMMKTMPDANATPYASGKMIHSTGMGGARVPQYQASYPYHPHGYPAAVSAGHHTYQSQSVCDDSRWMWNGGSGGDYQSSCRSAYPAYASSSVAKQGAMWPTMPMQYPNSMSTGYPNAAAVTNQSCCPPEQGAANYYSQQYVKHQMQSISNAMNYDGGTNDLYSSNPQANSALPPATAQAKVYTDLNAQPQENSYQSMATPSYHQPANCNAPTALDYNSRYLQQQQQASLPASSSSATAPYSHHYYHNLHPYAHQTFGASDNQESLYSQQQGDTKIGVTTKSQSLRDFLTSWNEDEDECSDRTMMSTDAPFMEPMHMSSDYYTQPQEQQHNGAKSSPMVENHLQFKGSFTTRPKIHVGITVDSTVEPDQYINLPDIIIDIEKSNKDVVSIPEDILVTTVPKIEKEDVYVKEEKPEETEEPKPTAEQPTEVDKPMKKMRRKFLRRRRLCRQLKLRLIQRNQRKSRVCRKPQRSTNVRLKKLIATPPRESLNPQSLKCLCVSLLNSDKFRNRVLGQSEIDNLINLTTDNEVKIDVAAALGRTITSGGDTLSPPTSAVPASEIPKLSDLCKNALNSSFDRDVLVINLDEILDSDSLFVVQCDINENILENYVDDTDQASNNSTGTNTNTNTDDITHNDLVEILNDNNNNYDSSTGSGNYIPTAVTTNPIGIPASNVVATATATANADATATATNGKAVTSAIKKRKRCCSVTEVSNLPLGNAVEHNNSNSTNTIRTASANPLESHSSPLPPQSMSPSLNSPCSRSCPAALCCPPSPLIEQNCPTQQITVGHERLHEMLVLSGIVHDVLQNDIKNDDQPPNDTAATATAMDDSELLMLVSAVGTPSIHHEEIVPDNLKKFQNEKFLKYLHAKYVQGSLSEFYHANRIIKKYKKRIIKKILNIVR